VRKYAEAGIEIIKARIDLEPTALQKTILGVVVDEAKKHTLDVMVHASSVPAMLAALDAGSTKLVHTPHGSWMSEADARKVAAAGVEVVHRFGLPVFGVFNRRTPTFRDGSKWPDEIIEAGSGRAGEKTVNARTPGTPG
jgi:imidazolonepropionase-like amidohydrolase